MYNGSSTSALQTASDTGDVAGTLQRGVQQAGEKLHTTIEKVAQPTLAAVERTSASAHETVDRVASGVQSAAERVDAQTKRLQEMPHRAADHARDYVRERPLQAVAFAAAFGWLVGRLGARD